jgi:hypothetical protein
LSLCTRGGEVYVYIRVERVYGVEEKMRDREKLMLRAKARLILFLIEAVLPDCTITSDFPALLIDDATVKRHFRPRKHKGSKAKYENSWPAHVAHKYSIMGIFQRR